MHRQRIQSRLLALAGGGIQAREFVQQNVHRPAVGDNVVQGHPQLMGFVALAYQGDPQQRPALQVEGLARLVFAQLLNAGRGFVPQVQAVHLQRQVRQHALHRLAVVVGKHRAQRFMAGHQRLEAAAQRSLVQFAAQAQAPGIL